MNLHHNLISVPDAPTYHEHIINYAVFVAGMTIYVNSRHLQESPPPPCPAFEVIIAKTNIDRIIHDNPSAETVFYIDHHLPIAEAKYQVSCNQQIFINNTVCPWHSFIRGRLLDSGLHSGDCDHIIRRIRGWSDVFLRTHRACGSTDLVMIPSIVVKIDFIFPEVDRSDYISGAEFGYGEETIGPMLDASFLEHQVMTVPASGASIRALEIVKAIDHGEGLIGLSGIDGDDRCAICLDGLLGGDDEEDEDGALIRMPCKHMFHRDCITTWLSRNRACPLCRYELPAASLS